jgi:endonuclease YncB( thermonuclease family)
VDGASAPESTRHWLQARVEGRTVEVIVFCASRIKEKAFEGRVSVQRRELNMLMLAQGLARYRDSGALIDRFNDCQYGAAEERAKTAELGIWSRSNSRPNERLHRSRPDSGPLDRDWLAPAR